MNYSKISELILKKILGAINKDELSLLENWTNKSSKNKDTYQKLISNDFYIKKSNDDKSCDAQKAYKIFEKRINHKNRKLWYRIAATVILFLGISIYFGTKLSNNSDIKISQNICPGKANAILTFSDGQKILVNKKLKDTLITKEGIFLHTANNIIRYSDKKSQNQQVNKLDIPKNSEYQIILSDGTEIKLNSDSHIEYPVTFNKNERIVKLRGEAYFHVKKDSSRPFYVITDDVKLRVYGTKFNINTNHIPNTQAVLVSGSIGIIGLGAKQVEHILKPSQMAEFDKYGNFLEIKNVNSSMYISWTQGCFSFENEKLESVMHSLSLWYDVDVFFANQDIKDYPITGHMERYKNIKKILSGIEKISGYNINIKGRTIILSN